MATITTRAGKGSPLTNTEVDDNFTNLNTDKAELSGATFTGNVGIGASPDTLLHVHGAGSGNGTYGAQITIGKNNGCKISSTQESADDDVQGLAFFTKSSNQLSDSAVERMRIDSSGNLLVGTTESNVDNNTSGKGIVLAEGGYVQIAREATAQTQGMLHLNATGVDANMIEFKKDAVAAGFIGTKDGDIYLGTGDTGLRFYDDGNQVYPAQASDGAGRDAAVDLGSTSKRFKDLRLSGTAYVGSVLIGTTAATPNAKLKVNGAAILNDSVIYSKAYSTLDTTGHVVAKATGGTNGKSTTFIFTGQGGGGAPFHIVFSCINAGGQWSATRSEIAASSSVDVVASTSGNDVLFTFKSKSGTQPYSPRVRIETIGNFYDTAYLAA